MATGMKRLGILAAVIVVGGVAAVTTATLVIPVDTLRDAVTSEIAAVTGFEPILRGPISVSMFPAPTVRFSNVALGGHASSQPASASSASAETASSEPVAIEELTAHLRLPPLLGGRIEIADITLTRPRIDVTFEPDGHTNWSSLVDTLARALKPNAARDERVLSFSEIRIEEGTIAVRDPGRDVEERLDDVTLSLAWPSPAKSFGATGHFMWHDENVDTNVAIADFPAALAGDTSGLKFRFSGTTLKAAFDGTMSYEPTLKIDGTLAADAAALRDALRWAGGKTLPGGGLGGFALKAHAALNNGTIAFSNVNIELDGNAAEGALTYATTGRQMLQGTLAVEKLDLSSYFSSFRLNSDDAQGWDSRQINLDWFNGWDADLRLSAAGVRFARAALGHTAISANMRSGRLVITVGESQSFGGTITGKLEVGATETGVELKSQMQFADVDLEKSLSDLFGVRHLEGTGNLGFSLESAGATVQDIVRNLNGTVLVTASKGAISGINAEQLLRRLQRSPLSNNADFRSGRTPFDKLTISLKVEQGVAKAEDVHLDGPTVRFVMTGSGSLLARDLDFSGTANLISAPSDPNGSFELPFVVQGPWQSPLITPDLQTLIRRSSATAPLIDALQDRKTRDAVRAAIERLTGAGGAARDGNPR